MTIVGAVMGGALAVQFTLDHPEMSEGFVCAASNSGPGEHAGGIAVLPWTSLAGTKRGLMAAFYNKSLITDDVVRARFAYRLQAGDGYTIQRHLSDHRPRYSVGCRAPPAYALERIVLMAAWPPPRYENSRKTCRMHQRRCACLAAAIRSP